MCSGFLCRVCGPISLRSWLFLWLLICGLVQVLFLSLGVNFYFSIAIFLLLTLGLGLYSGTYLNKLQFL